MLCGCSKKTRRPDRSSSVYVASASDELSFRPPTSSISDVAPAACDSVAAVAAAAAPFQSQHVESYIAGARTAVTVSVRHANRHHKQHPLQTQHRRQNVNENDADAAVGSVRQLNNYDTVLDGYLLAAIATQDADNVTNCRLTSKVIS